jgi:hypothetical protein
MSPGLSSDSGYQIPTSLLNFGYFVPDSNQTSRNLAIAAGFRPSSSDSEILLASDGILSPVIFRRW